MNKGFIVVLLLLVTTLFAENELLEKFNRANALAESGETAQAKSIYEYLLQQYLEPWQRAVITYNLGNLYLQQKEWERAKEVYQSIPEGTSLQPVINFRVERNRAYIDYNLGLEKLHNDPEGTLKQFEQVSAALDRAEKNYCELQKVKGLQICDYKDTMHTALIQEEALARKEIENQLQQPSQLSKGLETLKKVIENSFQQIQFLKTHPLPKELVESYLEDFKQENSFANPLLDHLEENIATMTDAKKNERQELFNQVQTHFEQGVAEIERDLDKADVHLKQAKSELDKLLQIPLPPQEIPQAMEQRQSELQKKTAHVIDPVLQSLIEMEKQDKLEKTIKKTVRQVSEKPW